MTNTVLVTCMYSVTYNKPIGGRGYPVMTYFPSLQNIFAFNLPLIIYTDKKEVETIEEFCQKFGYKNYEIRAHDLSTFRHYNKILEAKEKYVNPDYRYYHRCEVLCHTKLHFVEQSYNNKWNCQKVVWIDAGITECSKVPVKYGGRELGENSIIERYAFSLYPNNKESLFKPELGIKLDKFIEDKKWFFVTLTNPFDGINSPWLQIMTDQAKLLYNVENITKALWVVGTFFGGYRDQFDEIYSTYNKMVDNTIDQPLFPKTEEMYLSIINYVIKKPSLYFNTWYGDVPEEAEYLLSIWENNPNFKSFYKIFRDILE